MRLMRMALGFLFFSQVIMVGFDASGNIAAIADTGTAEGGNGGLDMAASTLSVQGGRELSSFLSETVNRGDVPGVVVLVTAPDHVLYHEAFGKMSVAQGVEMRKDAIFRVASI